ncbi:TonB-dependent receptor [Sphingosinicella rhizophila]|uniref:TonB-dependent receptor n=1 Tax=Sphingosinicella rhizophila TaxID=3050082 RepID=A0ABU3Q9Z6_9SPHN|nr:TonB-dependent receptor [Sphingosinicella sp. GR2756]MDT9600196.1 TonB-dependent receptor [Sphingosinicella sp. GR2756]
MMHRNLSSFARLSGSAAAAAIVFAMPLAAQAQAATYSFDIPSQDLGKALRTFGRVSRQPVSFNSILTRGKRSAQIKGNYTVDEGLRALLGDSGLSYTRGASGVLMVTGQTSVAEPVAQGGPTGDQAAADSAADINADDSSGDIVVTAQKREERLKDVPAAVTAVTADTFQEINATKIEDYVARIPGLTVSQVGGAQAATQLTIRGISTGPGGNPTVGIYIDGSPFGASNGTGAYTIPDIDPQDLARVEVLRGPQGTLYGAGSLGGLFKYVTADPDPSRFFGRLQVDASTVDGGGEGYGIRGAINVPLAENAAMRVSGFYRLDPGYVDNVLLDEKNVNELENYGFRAALGWDLGENWKVRLAALYQHYDGQAAIVDYNSFTMVPAFGDLKQERAFGAADTAQNVGAYSLQIEGDLGFATLTSASAYNHQKMLFNLDYTTVLGPLFPIPDLGLKVHNPASLDKYSQEIRLTSPSTNRLSWQIGGFYTHEKFETLARIETFDKFTGVPITGLPDIGSADGSTKFEEIAGFGNITYRFSDQFDVTAGLRYSSNKQHNVTAYTGLLFGNKTDDARSSDNSLTFLVNPRLRLNENLMVYGRIASGFRPGGPNYVPGLSAYEPDKVTDYEIGLKADVLDRKMSIELSAYWIDWKNIQIQRVNTLGSFIDNGPSAVSKGLEASVSWRPVRGLDLYANAAYNDAHLTEDMPVGSAIGFDGDRLPLSARFTAAAGFNYQMPLSGEWNATLGGDFRHVGDRLGAFPNPGQPRFVLPSYEIVDLRVGVSDDRWSLTVFAKNLTDARGRSADVNLGVGLTSVSIIQPRTFGVSGAVKF